MGKSVLVAVVFLLYFLICAKNWGYTTKLGKKMGVEEKGVREWHYIWVA